MVIMVIAMMRRTDAAKARLKNPQEDSTSNRQRQLRFEQCFENFSEKEELERCLCDQCGASGHCGDDEGQRQYKANESVRESGAAIT